MEKWVKIELQEEGKMDLKTRQVSSVEILECAAALVTLIHQVEGIEFGEICDFIKKHETHFCSEKDVIELS